MSQSLIIPVAEIRDAVGVLCSGLVEHEVVQPDDWDAAVGLVARAHQQCGGATRENLYRCYRAASDNSEAELQQSLRALVAMLTTGEATVGSAEQLELFTDQPANR